MILALFLAACGGGGGDEQGTAAPVTVDPPAPLTTQPAAPPPSALPPPAAAPRAAEPPAAAAPAPAPAAPPSMPPLTSQALIGGSCGLPEGPVDVLARLNAARSGGHSCGGERLGGTVPLAWNEQLFAAAAGHSADMAARNYFAHETPGGGDAASRMAAAGYGWSAAGENIAAGDASLDGVIGTWLRSDGHCRNIMNPVFTEVAVACVRGGASTRGTYWTMVLGRR